MPLISDSSAALGADRSGIAQVELERRGLATALGDAADQGLGAGAIAMVGHRDVAARSGKLRGNGLADAAGSSGNRGRTLGIAFGLARRILLGHARSFSRVATASA